MCHSIPVSPEANYDLGIPHFRKTQMGSDILRNLNDRSRSLGFSHHIKSCMYAKMYIYI